MSRYGNGASDSPTAVNALFADAMERSAERSLGGQAGWTPADGLPDIYIAMGQTAENVREHEGVWRQEMDEFAVRSQERAVASIDNGFFEREIVPVTLPDGSVVAPTTGRGREPPSTGCRAEAGLPPGRAR